MENNNKSLCIRQNTLPEGYFRVVAQVRPFQEDCLVDLTYQQGKTLQDVLDVIQPNKEWHEFCSVFVEDQYIFPALLHKVRPKSGATVYVKIVPGAPVIPIIAAVAAAAAQSAAAAALTAALGATLASVVGAVIGGIVAFGINAIGSALFASSKPSDGFQSRQVGVTAKESPTFSISGARNDLRQYRPVPCVLGTHKHVPPYGAAPFTEVSGDDQFLRFVVVWGYGPVDVSDIRIGNTPISSFQDVETEDDFDGTLDTLTLYPSDVTQEDLSILLTEDAQTRNTAGEVDEFGVTFTWPGGLYRLDGTSRNNESVTITAEYRLVGAGSWTAWFSETYTDDTAEVKRIAVRKTDITRGEYEIRISRSALREDTLVVERVLWTALRSFLNEDPIQLAGVAKSAYRIRASDQLNGVVDQLNGVVSMKIPTWTGSGWTAANVTSATSNPAAIYRYVLSGAPNKRPLASSKIDDENLGEWYEFCEAQGFTYDGVIDYRTSVRELLQDIGSAGRATPRLMDDKWGVIIDKERTTIVQHFTPRNTRNFSHRIILPEIPEGFRIRFLNKNAGYREDERIVYDDGFDASNATKFEVLELPGQTDPANVYKLGRYYLAGLRLRPEMFTFETDIQHIVCTRGDLIRFNHDVVQIGQGFGRIKSIASNVLTLDDEVTMEAGNSYSIRVRQADGTSNLQAVTLSVGTTKTITVASASGLAAGDLYEFGITGQESVELLISNIENGDDLSATLTCVPYSSAIYNAANTIPDYETVISTPVSASFNGPPAPSITNVISDEAALQRNTSGSLDPAIIVYFQPGNSAPSNDGTITRTTEYQARFRESGTSGRFTYSPKVSSDARSIILRPVDQGIAYDIEVQAIGPFGEVSNRTRVSNHIVLGAIAPPPQVNTFKLNTIGDHTYVEWTYADIAIDVIAYEIRYHPDQDITDWGTMLTLSDSISRDTRSFTVPSRKGSYAIKAIDINNTKSISATYINATLEDPEALNVVETLTEAPDFTGTKSDVIVVDGALQLASASVMADWDTLADVVTLTYGAGEGVILTGTYETDAVDLSEVYTSRISADVNISSENFLNVMSTWSTLAEVATISGTVGGDDYTVDLEIAYSRDDNLSPTFTDYQRFAIGDYTARHVKFRATLTSASNEVTPIVTDMTIHIDMPDRVTSGDDIASGAGTKSITFSPAFRVLKSVNITGQDLATGDYPVVSNKTRTGFDVTFRNSAGTAVDRTFDYQAVGYGRERAT